MPLIATSDDMLARYSAADLEQLTDGDGAPDQAKLGEALRYATNLVEAHVAARHQLASFAATPPMLVDVICDLAFARLHSVMPDNVAERDKQARRTLEQISKGTLRLDGGEGPVAEPRPGAILLHGDDRIFDRASMSGM